MENTYIKMSSNYSARLKRYKVHHLLISVVVTVFLFMNCYVSLQNALVAESRLQIVTGDNCTKPWDGDMDMERGRAGCSIREEWSAIEMFRIYKKKYIMHRLKWNFPLTRFVRRSFGRSGMYS